VNMHAECEHRCRAMGENEGYWRNGAMEREGKGGV
jgi:hypothetical protein